MDQWDLHPSPSRPPPQRAGAARTPRPAAPQTREMCGDSERFSMDAGTPHILVGGGQANMGPAPGPSALERSLPGDASTAPRRAPAGTPLRPGEPSDSMLYHPGGLPSMNGPPGPATYTRRVRSFEGEDCNRPAGSKKETTEENRNKQTNQKAL